MSEKKSAERHCVSEKKAADQGQQNEGQQTAAQKQPIRGSRTRGTRQPPRSSRSGAGDSRPETAVQGQQNEGQQPAAQKQSNEGQLPAARSSRARGSTTEIKLLTTSKSYSAEREIMFSRIRGAFGNNYGPVYISYRGTEVSVSI